mmetsp:Transcript_11275/g.24932  ORF Transcript_11275/g.24932 Transcript_11275/m.24932 type:complete len:519 (-) Transcript_11275:984-2540(-)
MQGRDLRIGPRCSGLQRIHQLLHPLQLSCLRLNLSCQRNSLALQIQLCCLQPRDPLPHGSALVTGCTGPFEAGEPLLEGLQLGDGKGVQPGAQAGDLLLGGLGLSNCGFDLGLQVLSVQGCHLRDQPLDLSHSRSPRLQLAHPIGQRHQCALRQPHAPLRRRGRCAGLLSRGRDLVHQALRLIRRGVGVRRALLRGFNSLNYGEHHLVCRCGVALQGGHPRHQLIDLLWALVVTHSQLLVHEGVELRQPRACVVYSVVQRGQSRQLLCETVNFTLRGVHGLGKLGSQTRCLLFHVFGGILRPFAGGCQRRGIGDTVLQVAKLLADAGQLPCGLLPRCLELSHSSLHGLLQLLNSLLQLHNPLVAANVGGTVPIRVRPLRGDATGLGGQVVQTLSNLRELFTNPGIQRSRAHLGLHAAQGTHQRPNVSLHLLHPALHGLELAPQPSQANVSLSTLGQRLTRLLRQRRQLVRDRAVDVRESALNVAQLLGQFLELLLDMLFELRQLRLARLNNITTIARL